MEHREGRVCERDRHSCPEPLFYAHPPTKAVELWLTRAWLGGCSRRLAHLAEDVAPFWPSSNPTCMRSKKPIHPGEFLFDEFLLPRGISQRAFAAALRWPPRKVNELVIGKRGITAEMASELGNALGTSMMFWVYLQVSWALYTAARRKGATGALSAAATRVPMSTSPASSPVASSPVASSPVASSGVASGPAGGVPAGAP